jgi:MFS family permease
MVSPGLAYQMTRLDIGGLDQDQSGLAAARLDSRSSASVGDVAPRELRGAAFGIYDLAVGVATFVASSAAGVLWMVGGPELAFGFSGLMAVVVVVLLLFQPAPRPVSRCS